MKEKLEQRLQHLQQEYESGQQMLADLQAKEANLQQTLLRISGAMQVLQELLQAEEPSSANGSVSERGKESLGVSRANISI
ncbi:MAG: hypothetical protein AAF921_03545 [Cyanobacteria bacterium P01_D01_bin.44]